MVDVVSPTMTTVHRSNSNQAPQLPQDLAIEILSHLNLTDSNHLAHVNHEWLQASRVERRRSVQLSQEFVTNVTKSYSRLTPHTFAFWTSVAKSPLARLITHLPSHEPFLFTTPEAIHTAHNNFPNLLQIYIQLDRLHSMAPEPLTRPFQLPTRLTNISILHINATQPLAQQHQQFYVDALSSASQLHTVSLSSMDSRLNLTVLTQLPLLTDLTMYRRAGGDNGDREPAPLPENVLQILMQLKQLVTLGILWTVLPDQWCQLRLPQLREVTLDNGYGPNCSTDLVSLAGTVMVKSLRQLRLQLDAGADLSKLLELVKFTQLESLDLYRTFSNRRVGYSEKDMSNIHVALIQLKNLTSLKIRIYPKEIHLSEVLNALIHLTSLELNSESQLDLSFLHTPAVRTRLVDLNLKGYFTKVDILDGLLECVHLRRLELHSWSPSSNEWFDQLKRQLDSRRILPQLENLEVWIFSEVDDHGKRLAWDLWTGPKTHPNFRRKRSQPLIELIGTDARSLITRFLRPEDLRPLSQVNHLFYDTLQRQTSYYQLPFPSFSRTEFNILAYQRWRNHREPLIMTPPELLVYSRNLVMSHQSDIILHIDGCIFCSTPHLSPYQPSSSNSTPSPSTEEQLNLFRLALQRFRAVRALKILLRPSLTSFNKPCPCQLQSSDSSFAVALIDMCLEVWGSELISFEIELNLKYDFVTPKPKNLITSHMHHLTSVQHVGIYLPPIYEDYYDINDFTTNFLFPSSKVGVLTFSGHRDYYMLAYEMDGNQSRQPLPTPVYSNAIHCIWLGNSSKDIFEFLEETHEQSLLPFPYSLDDSYLRLPPIPFYRSQIRHMQLDPVRLRRRYGFGQEVQTIKSQLEVIQANFTNDSGAGVHNNELNSNTPTAAESNKVMGDLQSLVIRDIFEPVDDDADHHRIDYRSYLHLLRHQLRTLSFITNSAIDDWSPIKDDHGSNWAKFVRLRKPRLPFHLLNDDDHVDLNGSELVWSKLEALHLSYKEWELLDNRLHQPIDQESWMMLGEILPRVHTLSVSCRLIPVDHPFIGLLTQIKHFHIHQRDLQSDDRFKLGEYVRVIIVQLRQLESLHLNIKWHIPWNSPPSNLYLTKSLLPLLLSSERLQLLTLDYSHFTPNLDEVTQDQQRDILLLYSIWQLLQPSKVIPFDYSTTRDLLAPFLSTDSLQSYDNSLVELCVTDRTKVLECNWLMRLELKVKGWKPIWKRWRHEEKIRQEEKRKNRNEKLIASRQILLKQIQADLHQQMKLFYESMSSPSPSSSPPPPIRPRPFTIQLIPEHPTHPTIVLDQQLVSPYDSTADYLE